MESDEGYCAVLLAPGSPAARRQAQVWTGFLWGEVQFALAGERYERSYPLPTSNYGEHSCSPILHHQPAVGSADTNRSQWTSLNLGAHRPFPVPRACADREWQRQTPTKTLRTVLPKSSPLPVALRSLDRTKLRLLYSSVHLILQHS